MAEVKESASTSVSYGGVAAVEAVDDAIFSIPNSSPNLSTRKVRRLFSPTPIVFSSFFPPDPIHAFLVLFLLDIYLPFSLLIPCL